VKQSAHLSRLKLYLFSHFYANVMTYLSAKAGKAVLTFTIMMFESSEGLFIDEVDLHTRNARIIKKRLRIICQTFPTCQTHLIDFMTSGLFVQRFLFYFLLL